MASSDCMLQSTTMPSMEEVNIEEPYAMQAGIGVHGHPQSSAMLSAPSAPG